MSKRWATVAQKETDILKKKLLVIHKYTVCV